MTRFLPLLIACIVQRDPAEIKVYGTDLALLMRVIPGSSVEFLIPQRADEAMRCLSRDSQARVPPELRFPLPNIMEPEK